MIAKGFLDAGATVYITARDAAECAATAQKLGPKCIAMPRDLSSIENIRICSAKLADRVQTLGILVNNAGTVWSAEFTEFPEQGVGHA